MSVLIKAMVSIVLVACSIHATAYVHVNEPTYNNELRYLSPMTSDEVTALWVDKVIKAKAGSSIGRLVGIYAGKRALKSIPLIGGIFGGDIGAEAGRRIVIKLVGGIDVVVDSSDISFRKVTDLAYFLYANYSHREDFEDIIEITELLYPEMKEAKYLVFKQLREQPQIDPKLLHIPFDNNLYPSVGIYGASLNIPTVTSDNIPSEFSSTISGYSFGITHILDKHYYAAAFAYGKAGQNNADIIPLSEIPDASEEVDESSDDIDTEIKFTNQLANESGSLYTLRAAYGRKLFKYYGGRYYLGATSNISTLNYNYTCYSNCDLATSNFEANIQSYGFGFDAMIAWDRFLISISMDDLFNNYEEDIFKFDFKIGYRF